MALPETPQALEIGKGRIVREGKTVAILSLGTRLDEAEKAADQLEAKGLSTTVADLRFAKPLDEELIRKLLTTHEVAVTIEEAAIGGLGAHVLTLASDEGLIDAGLKLRTMRLPDRFQDQDKPEKQYDEAGLNAAAHRRDGAESLAATASASRRRGLACPRSSDCEGCWAIGPWHEFDDAEATAFRELAHMRAKPIPQLTDGRSLIQLAHRSARCAARRQRGD